MTPFAGSFTQQEPIPEAAIAAAVAVMRSGRLHRYNLAPGETGAAAALEAAFADWQGAPYCLACASGGAAMAIALRAAGIGPGDRVLTNGFTLAPVPGAIAAVGAEPVLAEITEDLVVDLDDVAAKLGSVRPRAMLLSNMRGHLCDIDALAGLCARAAVPLIEDCAHTMGATWRGRKSGGFGLAGCFSTQTYKHMNSGEGGLLVSSDAGFMARATVLSGSYMLYGRHGAGPDADAFAGARLDMPNTSARMDNLRAALLLPQLAALDGNLARWNERHDRIAARLARVPGLRLPLRPDAEGHVGSSIQFALPGRDPERMEAVVERAAALGVELKWFGAPEPRGFTSAHGSWRYVPRQDLPRTDAVLAVLLDMRIPLTFTLEDCDHVAEIVAHCVAEAR